MPHFAGTYFYGDFCAGSVRSFEILAGAAVNPADWTTELGVGFGLTSFGVDAQGEIYITSGSGVVWKIVPPFPDMEVSGPGAGDPFLLQTTGNWSWEDLEFSSMHPVDYYQVYRGVPNGVFQCIHSTTATQWSGDPTVPGAGQVIAYLVTAVNPAGEESSGGVPARTLQNPCAPPP